MSARAIHLSVVLLTTSCTGLIHDPLTSAPSSPGGGPVVSPSASPSPTPGMPGPTASPTPSPSPSPSPPPVAPPFACTPGVDPTPEALLRLTPTQHQNVLEDLLGRAFTPSEVRSLFRVGPVATALAALPVDGSAMRGQLVYDSEDQRVSTVLVEPQIELASEIAAWITADAGRLQRFAQAFGGSACSAPDAAGCADALIDGFGSRALRRPLDDDDRRFYRAAFDDTTWGGHAGLVATLLLAPDFLYRTELRGDAVDGRSDLSRLTAYERAARLSFALTNSMPDEALLAAAAADFAGPGLDLDAQVTRLLGTPRARAQLEHQHRQWLRLDRVPAFNPSAVDGLAVDYPDDAPGPLPPDLDLAQLRLDAFEELVALVSYYSATGGSLADVLTSQLSFARSPELAAIYGVEPWAGPRVDGTVDPAQLVELPPGQRAGLFTRVGYLISGFPDTNPVMRGARLRVEYLCDTMVPPADTTPPAGYRPPAVPTIRNEVTAKTEIEGTACRACHQTSINPLGFTFETFDAFGRRRTQEPLRDGTGQIAGWAPIDARTQPNIDRNGDTTAVADAVELSGLLAETPRVHACFARHLFRYVEGRREQPDARQDGCVLAEMEQASRTGSIQETLRALVTDPRFGLRKLPEGN